MSFDWPSVTWLGCMMIISTLKYLLKDANHGVTGNLTSWLLPDMNNESLPPKSTLRSVVLVAMFFSGLNLDC